MAKKQKQPTTEITQKIKPPRARGVRVSVVGYSTIFIAILITVVISIILYRHTVNLLTENLHHRLEAIVRTAAVQFEANDLDKLKVLEDYKTDEYQKVVKQLIKIRENNEDIVFAYILRKIDGDHTSMEFVADSHSLDPFAKIDLDGNGLIDDADALNYPGDIYEDVPVEAFDGYQDVTTNKELYEDQWGVLISGYAPIKRVDGTTAAVISVDIRADDFFVITNQTLFPFLAFIIFLVVVLLLLATILIHVWNKRVEFMSELDKQKDELLSIVSHQLATPISSVKWYLEMLIDGDLGKLTKEQNKHIKSMISLSADLSDLVSMILDVSRIQLGRMRIDAQDFKLSELIDEILTAIIPRAIKENVDLQTNVEKSLPTVCLDKRLMRMTLENLLSNAVKYTHKGGKVSFIVKKINNNELYIEVKDNGCGIPKSDQAKIFGKLFRASNTKDIRGNGFGLYVAKGAIEAQGGGISFESTEGKGTTFYVKVPVRAKLKPSDA